MNSREQRREQWRRMIEQQEKTGQSVRVFCQAQGLSEPSFYNWRQRLRNERPVSFALVETKEPRPDTAVELVLVSGERLRIPPEPATLRLVLSVLRERP